MQDSFEPSPSETERPVEPYRPTHRPPMARLMLFDDGALEGETIRIRKDITFIGRENADVNVPHDPLIAARHLCIVRDVKQGQHRWIIKDLENTSGLWVRARRIELREGSEFLAGLHRYRFQEAKTMNEEEREAMIRRLENGSFPGMESMYEEGYASLTRVEFATTESASLDSKPLSRGAVSKQISLIDGEYWIGRAKECALQSPQDTFLADKHVCISRASNKRWTAKTDGVPNGMWMRMDQIIVNNSCTFQIGEQRCRFACSWARDEV